MAQAHSLNALEPHSEISVKNVLSDCLNRQLLFDRTGIRYPLNIIGFYANPRFLGSEGNLLFLSTIAR